MLHLAVKKDFSYLNYLSVMSAIINNEVKIWVVEEPDNKYWELVKKMKMIEFVETTPEKGISLSYEDKVGRLDAIYLGELSDNYTNEYVMEHENLYEPTGEFTEKDITIVKVTKPELITPEYVKTSDSVMAQLIRRVLLERVWYV
jgi:hypothetical protein